MNVNSYSNPEYARYLTKTENANGNNLSPTQTVETSRSAKRSENQRSGTVGSVPGVHLRLKRETDSSNGQADIQSSPPGHGDESHTVGVIGIDPDSMAPVAQRQFQNFYQAVKATKENMPPDISRQASNFIRDRIQQFTGMDVDPEKTFLYIFNGAEALQDGNDGVTGFQHGKNDLKASMTLTDFVLGGLSNAWRADTSDVLNMYFGLYSADSGAEKYGANNEVRILPSDLRKIIHEGDLENYLTRRQESFWSTQTARWRALAKTEFSGLARKALVDGQLTQQGYQLAMNGAAPDVPHGKSAILNHSIRRVSRNTRTAHLANRNPGSSRPRNCPTGGSAIRQGRRYRPDCRNQEGEAEQANPRDQKPVPAVKDLCLSSQYP